MQWMDEKHRAHVEALLREAAAEHASLIARVPPALGASLPVDAQGITRAIDYLATAAGMSPSERRGLVRPHALNPAVLHARVFGGAPLARQTVISSFVEAARVRADALAALADEVGASRSAGRSAACSWPIRPPPVARVRTWWGHSRPRTPRTSAPRS